MVLRLLSPILATRLAFASALAILVPQLLSSGCGAGPAGQTAVGELSEVRLQSEDLSTVGLTRPASAEWDSLVLEEGVPVLYLVDVPLARIELAILTVSLPNGDPGARQLSLDSVAAATAGFESIRLPSEDSGPDPLVDLLTYSREDGISAVERIWPRGAGRATVLRASAPAISPSMLLDYVGESLAGARLRLSDIERAVRLSDNEVEDIITAARDRDVSLPPQIEHDLTITVSPESGTVEVVDTLTVLFLEAPDYSHVSLYLPAEGVIEDLVGSSAQHADSVICTPDSTSGTYRGLFTAFRDPFYVSAPGDSVVVLGQSRLSSSFCAEEWIYPGSGLPHVSYPSLRIVTPPFLVAYAPLIPDSVSEIAPDAPEQGSVCLVHSYHSPDGGFTGPLPWAVDAYETLTIGGGRSRLLYPRATWLDEQSLRHMVTSADLLAEQIWSSYGFEDAALDIVLVQPLVGEALLRGSGVLFLSPARLELLADVEHWIDSLALGRPVEGPSVAASAAMAFLERSTYLTPELRKVLAAHLVCQLAASASDDRATPWADLREALLKFYLYETERLGGIEYAIADPELAGTDLEEAVILGKGPLVLSLLSNSIEGFDAGLRRGLRNLRHSGYPYDRLASSVGLTAESRDGRLFYEWMFRPGVPQLHVTWYDSGGGAWVEVNQIQPGPEFPLRLSRCSAVFRDGTSETINFPAGFEGGKVFLPFGFTTGMSAITVDPDHLIPADITYERLVRDED